MGNSTTLTIATSGGGMESTLSVTRGDLRRYVVSYLGMGIDYSALTSIEQTRVDDIVKAGARTFYLPPILPGERSSHTWSFTRGMLSVPLVADTADYDLPADFGGLVDPEIEFSEDDNVLFSLKVTYPGKILALRQRAGLIATANGQPQEAAVKPKTFDEETGQRWQLMLWPTPAAAYTATAPYYSNPNAIADDDDYPLGGQPHAETLREACLAQAEKDERDQRGIHYAAFMERLATSVSHDRRTMGPKHFGYNADRSDRGQLHNRHMGQLVTYNGSSWN